MLVIRGQKKMTTIKCDLKNCEHNKNGDCLKDEISLLHEKNINCKSYRIDLDLDD